MSPIRAGDVFLVNHPGDAPTPHFCIALCDEAGNPPSAIIVPVNSKTNKTDPTVTLLSGDHRTWLAGASRRIIWNRTGPASGLI
jgi:hypothetical protein